MAFDIHHYHSLTKKYITYFGNVFNNITLIKYNKEHTAEISRIKVPIVYGPKEQYIYVLKQDIEKSKQVQVSLPLMSFEIVDISYDSSRQQNPIIRNNFRNSPSSSFSQFVGVPYDLVFKLQIYTRNADDAFQIVEQIFPKFQPDLNISVNLQKELGFIKDIPIILNSVNQEIEYEGDMSKSRTIIWTLNFTLKAFYYGPISDSKIIKRAFANTYLDPSLSTGYLMRLNLTEGNNGDYKIEDVVYQGSSLEYATAAGIVIEWHRTANNSRLRIGGVQGLFTVNNTIHSASTNASYKLETIDMTPLKIVSQKFEIDPFSANIGDPFGIIETTLEFPDTLED